MTCYRWTTTTLLALLLAGTGRPVLAQKPKTAVPAVPDLREILAKPQSELRVVVQRFEADRGSLNRFYTIPVSPTRHARLKQFYSNWRAALAQLDAATLGKEGRDDLLALKKTVERELGQLEVQAKAQAEIAPLVPFAPAIINLEEARRRMERVDSARAAGLLTALVKQIDQTRKAVETGTGPGGVQVNKQLAGRAAETTAALRTALKNWFNFYNGYDPVFTWWMGEPYKEIDQALQGYATFLRGAGGKTGAEKTAAGPERKEGSAPPAVVQAANGTDVPDLRALLATPRSELAAVVQRYQADRGKTSRFSTLPVPIQVPRTPERLARMKQYYADWLAALGKLDFDRLGQEGRIDYLLLRNSIERELRRLDLQAKTREATDRLLPFEKT